MIVLEYIQIFDRLMAYCQQFFNKQTRMKLAIHNCFRYKLAFKPANHDSVSPHCVSLPPDTDPLTAGSLAEMLRFYWNVGWHDGIDQVIEHAQSHSGDEEHDENVWVFTVFFILEILAIMCLCICLSCTLFKDIIQAGACKYD